MKLWGGTLWTVSHHLNIGLGDFGNLFSVEIRFSIQIFLVELQKTIQ